MGASSSVHLLPEEKAKLTKKMESLYAELSQQVSEVELYNKLSQVYEQSSQEMIAARTGSSSSASRPHSDVHAHFPDEHHGIHSDFHPDDEFITSKTSDELIQSINDNMDHHTGKVTSTITRLKSGADNLQTKTSSFRQRRLSLSQKTASDPEPPTPEKLMPKRTTIYSSSEIGVRQEKKAPFGADIFGTFSCHGIEPDPDSPDGIHEKINQDRGCVVYPFNSADALFMCLDGHGEQGDKVSQFVMTQIVVSLEKHPLLNENLPLAMKETFVKTNTALMTTNINYMFSGCTCIASYLRGRTLWVANVGDSRAVMAVKQGNSVVAKDLSRDHKPDDPEESLRIHQWGGFVAPPREVGLSARVYLDKEFTMIGLAMARSIGDYAVKDVGVIPEPEVKEFTVGADDKFMIMASDGVWEFISSQEAVDIVQRHIGRGADFACKELIQVATRKWAEEEGDYRDDITALVVSFPLPHMPRI